MPAGTDNGILTNVDTEYPDYLRDESRRVGTADSLSFPKTEEEICHHILAARAAHRTLTVQGARTGIAAGAVPEGGHVLSLSRMNRILDLRKGPVAGTYGITVQPGVTLTDLRKHLRQEADNAFKAESSPYFFPPDPTEASASMGGMVACNASGARSFHYGPTRRYVQALRVVLADGSIVAVRRGEHRTHGRDVEVRTLSGSVIRGRVPAYRMPEVKNASGYYAHDDMDLVDLFIGSEGTLGIISEIDLVLIPSPAAMWGIMAFFPSEETALQFVLKVRHAEPRPVAVEFFDCGALDMLREQRRTNPAFKEIPDMPAGWHTAIYVEYHGASDEDVTAAVEQMSEIMTHCGGSDAMTWISSDEREMERLKAFRHAVPEAVNLLIDQRRKTEPGLTKLGTDLAVPDAMLERAMTMYHEGLDRTGLEFIMFGHVGNNHLHVNIIPATLADYNKGKQLYLEWASEVVEMGGTVSAEHGIGKLKKALLRQMYGDTGIAEMQALKQCFDPAGILNPGNLF